MQWCCGALATGLSRDVCLTQYCPKGSESPGIHCSIFLKGQPGTHVRMLVAYDILQLAHHSFKVHCVCCAIGRQQMAPGANAPGALPLAHPGTNHTLYMPCLAAVHRNGPAALPSGMPVQYKSSQPQQRPAQHAPAAWPRSSLRQHVHACDASACLQSRSAN